MTPMPSTPTPPSRFDLAVGPVLYWWPRSALMQFYADIADSPADSVVLGETVCSRRHEMKPDDWLALARELHGAGKRVMLATQVLMESESDLRVLRRLAEQAEFEVEAGDASALRLLGAAGRPFVLGPHINVYSRPALVEHARLGATTWVAPAELSLQAIGRVNPPADPVRTVHEGQAPLRTQAFAFGRLPLAFSARCFTARHHRLSKDQCDFRCRDDADGLAMDTEEGQAFLVLNGIQTQSAAQHCLIAERDALHAAGVSQLRLSPTSRGFFEVLRHFEAVFNQGSPVPNALAALRALGLPGGLANGYARRRAGLDWSDT